MVEFAMVLPMLVMLLAGFVEFSRVFMVQQVITNAAREGARAGAVDLDDIGAIATAQSVSENYITASGVDLARSTVTPTFGIIGGTEALRVVVDYTYDSLLTIWVPGIPNTFTLESTAMMRREA